MINFDIDPTSFVSVTITKNYYRYGDRTDLTATETMELIKNPITSTSTSSVDHPDFAALRDMLGELGYIKIQRNSWNGDEVLKPFRLNTVKFIAHEKFCCACAIKWDVDHKVIKRNKRLNIESSILDK